MQTSSGSAIAGAVRPTRLAVVVNPKTRRDAKQILSILREECPRDIRLDVRVTEFAGHAADLARRAAPDADMLMAIGGDGTVSEVSGVARESGLPLAIVPAGSTNIIARSLGIPTNARSAIRLAWGANRLRTIDAGLSNDTTFLHMAGAGLDSMLFDLSNPALKRRVGWMAYVPAAISALRQPLATYTIRSTERTLEGVQSPLVLVANGAAIIAPRIRVDREIAVDDGWLDVFVVTATRPRDIARVMASLAMQQLRRTPYVEAWRTKAVEISSEPGIKVQFDGDVSGATPVSIALMPGAVQVVVPP